MHKLLGNIANLINPKQLIYLGLLIFLVIFYKATMQRGLYFGYIIASLPFIAIAVYLLLKKPLWSFVFLFIANYFVMGAMRYISFQGGILMDTIIGFCLITIIIKTTYEKVEWKRMLNPLALFSALWFLFCLFELLNPNAVPINFWASKVRGMAIYPLIMVILVSVLLNKYKYFKGILFIWSVLTLLGAFKGYWQKNHGFDSAEIYWLLSGGARTHIINSGIRFFSFFTDAGNYGSSMGFSMVVFSTACFFIKNKWIKYYYFIVALAGGYGMVISGTRGALAVPFAGYAFFILLSKNWKIAITSSIILLSGLFILNSTTIGEDNRLISRMRSAFNKNDPSLNVRLENQTKMKEYMSNLPFGASIGFDSESARNTSSFYKLSKIPTDSWYVKVWVQTGIVGLTLHIFLLSLSILTGGYIILFKIKNIELRGLLAGMLSGIFGMLVSAYGNELLGQFPNCYLFYICLSLVFMGEYYDNELEEHEQLT